MDSDLRSVLTPFVSFYIWFDNSLQGSNTCVSFNFPINNLPYIKCIIIIICSRFRMVKLTKRVLEALATIEFFTLHEWFFQTANMENLIKCVEQVDNLNQFNLEIASINWDNYMRVYFLGIREFIYKDSSESLNKARSRVTK